MGQLERDIARIAALRGRPADSYVAEAKYLMRRIPRDSIERIFAGNPDQRADLEFFDHLPQASRDFIRECWWPLSAGWWSETLHAGAAEDAVIACVLLELPTRLHGWIMRHYGHGHPSAAKLASATA